MRYCNFILMYCNFILICAMLLFIYTFTESNRALSLGQKRSTHSSFKIYFPLPLIQVSKLSVSGERMGTYW